MSLQINFDGLWDCETYTRIESTLRECVGTPPGDDEWNVSVTSYGNFCVVLVKTLQQTRRKAFELCGLELAAAIPAWLKEYPLE
jgi:hypothetical protein